MRQEFIKELNTETIERLNRTLALYHRGMISQTEALELIEDRFFEEKSMVETAYAEYTGGGIWIFYGKFWNGTYFLTDDHGWTRLLTADPSDLEVSTFEEWQQEHLIRDLKGDELKSFLKDLVDYLLTKEVDSIHRHGMTEMEIDDYIRIWNNLII